MLTHASLPIQMQAQYQDEHKVIAINGISEMEMFRFEKILEKEFPSIKQILPTYTTDRANPAGQPVGRWNILCTDPTFHSLAQDLYQRMPKLFLDHLQSQGTVLLEGAEPVTVASSFRGKPSDGSTVAAQTLDSDASSYLSNWTAELADYHLEADVPEEVLPFYNPRPDQEIPLQTSEPNSSWASVVASSVRQPSKDQNLKTSPHVQTSPTSLQNIILQLQNKLDRLETQLEEQKQARNQPAPTESPQRETPTPPPAPDPQTAQLASILHRIVERMDHLEAKMDATKDIGL
jgi:hypothetical protein